MPLVGKSQHLLVTPAVAESLDVVSGSVEAEGGGSLAVLYCLGKGFANAMHFLFSITIIGLEPTGHLAIDNFYLGAQYLDAVYILKGEERANPIVDAGAYHKYSFSFPLCFLNASNAWETEQIQVLHSEIHTELIEVLDGHSSEEMLEDELLCLPIREDVKFHQDQDGTIKQESQEKASLSLGKLDHFEERVLGGQRSIKIKTKYFFLFHFPSYNI